MEHEESTVYDLIHLQDRKIIVKLQVLKKVSSHCAIPLSNIFYVPSLMIFCLLSSLRGFWQQENVVEIVENIVKMEPISSTINSHPTTISRLFRTVLWIMSIFV